MILTILLLFLKNQILFLLTVLQWDNPHTGGIYIELKKDLKKFVQCLIAYRNFGVLC